MAIRVPMTPDANGIIKLSCGGQEMEILVTLAPASAPPPDDPGGAHANPNPPPASPTSGQGANPPNAPAPTKPTGDAGIDWYKFLPPGSKPHVTLVPIDTGDQGVEHLLDLIRKADEAKPVVFTTREALNFHKLVDLAGRMDERGLGDRFNVDFGGLGLGGGKGFGDG